MINNQHFGNRNSLPIATLNLLIINIGLWLITILMPDFGQNLTRILGLHYFSSPDFKPWQFFTYMFMHDSSGFAHIFFNMFALYSFGRFLEIVWGAKRFLIYYFVCGIGAGLIQEATAWFTIYQATAQLPADVIDHIYTQGYNIFNNGYLYNDSLMQSVQLSLYTPVIGASGAIFGILLGFALIFPNIPMYIFFVPVPIKAKYMVIGYAVLELVFGISGTMSSVAHFAHLGGMLFGLIFYLFNRQWFQRRY